MCFILILFFDIVGNCDNGVNISPAEWSSKAYGHKQAASSLSINLKVGERASIAISEQKGGNKLKSKCLCKTGLVHNAPFGIVTMTDYAFF